MSFRSAICLSSPSFSSSLFASSWHSSNFSVFSLPMRTSSSEMRPSSLSSVTSFSFIVVSSWRICRSYFSLFSATELAMFLKWRIYSSFKPSSFSIFFIASYIVCNSVSWTACISRCYRSMLSPVCRPFLKKSNFEVISADRSLTREPSFSAL